MLQSKRFSSLSASWGQRTAGHRPLTIVLLRNSQSRTVFLWAYFLPTLQLLLCGSLCPLGIAQQLTGSALLWVGTVWSGAFPVSAPRNFPGRHPLQLLFDPHSPSGPCGHRSFACPHKGLTVAGLCHGLLRSAQCPSRAPQVARSDPIYSDHQGT